MFLFCSLVLGFYCKQKCELLKAHVKTKFLTGIKACEDLVSYNIQYKTFKCLCLQ